MQGSLTRGDFVRLAYRLGRGAATGVLSVHEVELDKRHQLFLRRGYVTASRIEGYWAPLGEILRARGDIDPAQLKAGLAAVAAGGTLAGKALRDQGAASAEVIAQALRRQAELRLGRLAAILDGSYVFDAHGPPSPPSLGGQPVALATWARRHIEAQLDATRARALTDELIGSRLALRKHLAPDPTECDEADRRILTALASPRRLDELEAMARVPRYRLLALVHFLRVIEALEVRGVSVPVRPGDPKAAARRILGVDATADPVVLKRAYRRLARELHPDAHPTSSDAARRALAVRFAAVTDAYRYLLS